MVVDAHLPSVDPIFSVNLVCGSSRTVPRGSVDTRLAMNNTSYLHACLLGCHRSSCETKYRIARVR